MSVAYIFEIRGFTQEKYDKVIEALNLNLGGKAPAGQILHVAGPMEGGFRVIDVWESEEAKNRFFNEHLNSAFKEVGLELPRYKITFKVHNIMKSLTPVT
ncbi:MAG: hypothetical protein M1536_05365 [Firmicutes bacterium]|nr:hypothetical protein [Bacillota bacterium]